MSAPIIYSHDDPGAPVFLSGPAGFREILLGCLVNGYGDKPAAGWSVVYDDWVNSGNLSITNAAQSGVLGLWHPFTSYASYGPILYVAEAMQSATQPINSHSYKRQISDTSVIGYTENEYHFSGYRSSTDGMEWVVVATDNTAIVLLSRSTGDYLHGNPQAYFATDRSRPDVMLIGAVNHYAGFGDADSPVLGNFYLVGGHSRINPYSNNWSDNYIRASFLRNNDGTLVTGVRYAAISPLLGMGYPPDEVYSAELRPWRLHTRIATTTVFGGTEQVGRVPGLYSLSDFANLKNSSDFARFNPGVDAFRGLTTLIGKTFLYGVVGDANPIFISLSAEDW